MLLELINKAKLQVTKSTHKNRLSLYTVTINNQKIKKQIPFKIAAEKKTQK